MKTINKLENSKNKFYGWDEAKRAQKALFSLWSHLKRKKKIVISRSKILKEIKAQNDMILKYYLHLLYYAYYYPLVVIYSEILVL